jgi:hypothetical protein
LLTDIKNKLSTDTINFLNSVSGLLPLIPPVNTSVPRPHFTLAAHPPQLLLPRACAAGDDPRGLHPHPCSYCRPRGSTPLRRCRGLAAAVPRRAIQIGLGRAGLRRKAAARGWLFFVTRGRSRCHRCPRLGCAEPTTGQ